MSELSMLSTIPSSSIIVETKPKCSIVSVLYSVMALFEAILADFSYSYSLTFWVGNVRNLVDIS